MKKLVLELMVIVEGHRRNGAAALAYGKAGEPRPHQAPANPPHRQGRDESNVPTEQIIPLEENDFKDF